MIFGEPGDFDMMPFLVVKTHPSLGQVSSLQGAVDKNQKLLEKERQR